ncbi:MAG: isocitrate/isopropylmalate dehydrogenase family protein [Bdellovibrionales bacterium]|nr:isocitrate/isopropylmalate dehydrogenase family protein [Bdellovibrionales bacterium]
MTISVALIGGDGIGPEVVRATREVLEVIAPTLTYHEISAGYEFFRKTGETISTADLSRCREMSAILYGANTNPPDDPHYKSLTLTLRKELGLFANVRPAKSLPRISPFTGVDLVIVRENSEGLYIKDEEEIEGGAIARRLVTEKASERIVRYGCELAQKLGKSRVTLVHKANVLKMTCGLFRKVGFRVAQDFPNLTVDERFVDAMAMELVIRPQEFQIIVTTNLFGDILSDEASGLVGGLGVAPGANIGDGTAVFEPVHGSAPDIAGQGVANPLATILSAKLMLEHLGFSPEAEHLDRTVHRALDRGFGTTDIGGKQSTREFTASLIELLKG